MKCPMCNITLSDQRICPKCGREWLSQIINGEDIITSKPRIMELIDNLEEGKILDECIRPVPIHNYTYSMRHIEGIDDHDATFSTQQELHDLCPPLRRVRGSAFRRLMAMKIILDDPCTITIKRDDFEGDL